MSFSTNDCLLGLINLAVHNYIFHKQGFDRLFPTNKFAQGLKNDHD